MRLSLAIMVISCMLPCTSQAEDPKGFVGCLIDKDGTKIPFLWLGSKDSGPQSYTVSGKLIGGGPVKYRFEELQRIDLIGRTEVGQWERKHCEIIAANGNRATLENPYINDNKGGISYTFSDPVTGQVNSGSLSAFNLLTIEIGTQKGRMKLNPKSKAYFPSYYIFDPYDGSKLEWAD